MSKDSLSKPASESEERANNTEITLPDGVRLVVDWNKSEMTIKLFNSMTVEVNSKSKRVVVGSPEAHES